MLLLLVGIVLGILYLKEVTVQNGEITSINILEHRHERGKTAEVIAEKIVTEQKIYVEYMQQCLADGNLNDEELRHTYGGAYGSGIGYKPCP